MGEAVIEVSEGIPKRIVGQTHIIRYIVFMSNARKI